MVRRVTVTGFAPPPSTDLTPSCTVVPSSPLIRAMLVSMATSAVGSPSTVTMTSPGWRPAAAAGDPSKTLVITSPSGTDCSAAPMPEYSPFCFSSKALVSSGDR